MPLFPSSSPLARRIAVAGMMASLACSSSGSRARGGMNVLLVTIDTLRADHCSAYGYGRKTTPTLEELARQGTRMGVAYAPTATTGPSHASLMTSLYPITHGVVKNGMVLDSGFETLAEVLQAQGYRTAAVVSSFVLDVKFGYGQGFETYDDDFDAQSATIERPEFDGQEVEGGFDQTGDRTTEKASHLLARLAAGGEPFFLWVHYFDPHAPYAPPPEFASRFPADDPGDELSRAKSGYDGDIAFADHELGRLLAALDESDPLKSTLVVVVGDHGEGLMQHGHMHHGVQIYEEAVRVPLLFRLPERIAPRTLEPPVELVDVMPTILELARLEHPRPLQGRSLAAALTEGAPLDRERAVYLHRRHYDPGEIGGIPVAGEKFGIRRGSWKYIEGEQEGTRELFNLVDDPGERTNLVASETAVATELSASLAAWRAAHRSTADGAAGLSPEDRAKLRSLGYVD